ncbi:MAG: MATE family efflux transporter [Lachnospiraceae bacterium]|nr:MATE family efflux transporter [Lachnospiraceae bacterium]
MGMKIQGKTTAKDMTQGSIVKLILEFCLPLLVGNLFQMLYNTVDSLVVGNFVGTEALAAIGSTTMIVNMIVFFFNGMSTGATVLIGQLFGAHDKEGLHVAVETTMGMTFLFSIIFSILGVFSVPYMLRFMSTPEDVLGPATTYLTIYFTGISGLLIYNMGSGILRAVGDSVRPLLFLIFTSVLNTILDLIFVIVFGWGISGVAIATIVSQFLSAILIVLLLNRTEDIYRFTFHDMRIDKKSFALILRYGLPAAIQSTITAFSNVFVQSYVNGFGSACMAGWSCYNKIDQFIFLPVQSMAMAATAFVSQNIGAGDEERANKGTVVSLVMMEIITFTLATLIFIFAAPATGVFTSDVRVIRYSVLFLHQNVFFLCFNSINHTLAGALRGRGDSLAPMIIMLSSFVALRQLYLFFATRLIGYTERVVGFGYPVGWTVCCIIEVSYFYFRWMRKPGKGKKHI